MSFKYWIWIYMAALSICNVVTVGHYACLKQCFNPVHLLKSSGCVRMDFYSHNQVFKLAFCQFNTVLFYCKDGFLQSHLYHFHTKFLDWSHDLWDLTTKQNLFFFSMPLGVCMLFWWVLQGFPGRVNADWFFPKLPFLLLTKEWWEQACSLVDFKSIPNSSTDGSRKLPTIPS